MFARNRLSVRRATDDDLTAIVRIERASFGRDAWEREYFADYLSAPEHCLFLVAEKAGNVVGYALAVDNQTRSELDSIAVAPSHRGSGIAVALMNRLAALLRRRGVLSMTLMVRLDNTAAIGLYRRLGFLRERRINGYYEDGAPAWRMRR
jgi:[ribosomal protein S18]-alanine N-acetyltransferase